MKLRLLLIVALSATLFTGCSRSSGHGFLSLFGKQRKASSYLDDYDNWEPCAPMAEADEYGELTMNEVDAEEPGEIGSRLPGIEGFWAPHGKLAQMFRNVHFPTDKYAISGAENLETLKQIADYLAKHPKTHIFIEGHADERGAAAYNLALGSRRAHSVRSFLIQNGVSPDQLFTISFGKERPLVMGNGESSWRQNRRAQFKIYEK